MEKIEVLVSRFKEDILEYAKDHGYVDFKMMEPFYNDGVHFFYHNDRYLESKFAFDDFITDKMDEYNFLDGEHEICFTYDYRFEQETKKDVSSHSAFKTSSFVEYTTGFGQALTSIHLESASTVKFKPSNAWNHVARGLANIKLEPVSTAKFESSNAWNHVDTKMAV